jgi:hypothetical protein
MTNAGPKNIIRTFLVCVLGALAWSYAISMLSIQSSDVLFNVAFGLSLGITGLWTIYILWMGMLGRWYTEFTREIMSRLFGALTKYTLLWSALGGMIIYAKDIWPWIWREFAELQKTFDEHTFGIVTGGVLATVFVWLALRLPATNMQDWSRVPSLAKEQQLVRTL